MGSELLGIFKDAYENAYDVIARAIAFIKKIFAFFKGEPVEGTVENTEE